MQTLRGLVSLPITLALLSVTVTKGHAADEDGDYAVRGIGSIPCSGLVESVDSADGMIDQYLSWSLGYITARSRYSDGTFDVLPIIDTNAVGGLLYNVCQSNANATVETALNSLIGVLEPIEATESSEVVRLTAGDGETVIYRETLARAMDRLEELGFWVAADENEEGVDVAASLQAFQADRELAQTGLPDTQTLIELFLRQ